MPVKNHIGPSTEYLRHSRRGILVKRSENRFEEEQGAEERRADHSQLEEWTEQAKASGIADLKAIAVKRLQDTGTVVAALVLPYSQAQTEGRVN